MQPRVSVVIPTHNRASLLCEAIGSVLSQSYQNWELVVIDDGSTDETRQVVQKYAIQDPRIKYRYQENQGEGAARNAGISAASAQYLAFLDDDDLWFPEKLSMQMAWLESNGQTGFVYSPMLVEYRDGRKSEVWPSAKRARTWGELVSENLIPLSTVLIRRTCFEQCGVFDEQLPLACDWDMWLRVTRHFSFQRIATPLAIYRHHGGNVTGQASSRWYECGLRILQKFLNDPTLSSTQRHLVMERLTKELYLLGKSYLTEQRPADALQIFVREIRMNPLAGATFITANDPMGRRIVKLLNPYLATGYSWLATLKT